MNATRRRIIATGVTALALSLPGVGTAVAASGGSFVPNSPSDAPYIVRDYLTWGGAVYNDDTGNYRGVVASLGTFQSGFNISFTLYGSGNGSTAYCTLYAENMATGYQLISSGSSSSSTTYSYGLTAALSGAPSGFYAVNVFCQLPPAGSTSSYIIGTYQH